MKRLLRIEGVAPGGDGVAHDGARTVFVPFTAPGDDIEADVPPGDGPAHATLSRVLHASPDRMAPPCVHFGILPPTQSSAPRTEVRDSSAPTPDANCGGCEWLHLQYAAQLAAKEHGFFETLRRIAKLDPGAARQPIVPSPRPLRYRARAKFHFDRASGRLVYFRRRSHEPVRLLECILLSEPLDAFREAMARGIAAAKLEAREVTLEWSDDEGRGAAFVRVPAISWAARDRVMSVMSAVPGLAGVILDAEGSAPLVVGDPVLSHRRVPGDSASGVQRSRPDVFQQANRDANALLVDLAVKLLACDGRDVLELFCGSGNFTAALASRARSVCAVEMQGPALDLARAHLSGGNVRFFAGDALQLARAFARDRSAPRFSGVLLDPPREGARGLGPALRDLGIARTVYVSCDPATLARDVRGCVEAGFRVTHIQPVDMFPQTHHVEAVVLLER